MGILCVFCVYDTIGNRCFEKTSFPKMKQRGLYRQFLFSILHEARRNNSLFANDVYHMTSRLGVK